MFLLPRLLNTPQTSLPNLSWFCGGHGTTVVPLWVLNWVCSEQIVVFLWNNPNRAAAVCNTGLTDTNASWEAKLVGSYCGGSWTPRPPSGPIFCTTTPRRSGRTRPSDENPVFMFGPSIISVAARSDRSWRTRPEIAALAKSQTWTL